MRTDEERRRLAATFETAADLYERARPGYAREAVDWVLPADTTRVLDLGAGTGKLTAALVGCGADVVAIDPSPSMLARLTERLPEVDARVGSAEATGLADASVDAVVIGSALHWFDRPAADHEIARVLRPGGVVGVFGNQRDTRTAWVAVLNRLIDDATKHAPRPDHIGSLVPLDQTLFGDPEQAEFLHTQILDADSLAELVASRSYVIAMSDADRSVLLGRVRELARTHPDLSFNADLPVAAVRRTFELPYSTVVRRNIRR